MHRIAAENWYRTTHLADGISLIEEPHILPFYRCNIWHVAGRDFNMLVDSGMGVVSLREYVPLAAEKNVVAVASHSHFDHVGCHHEFEERWIHEAEASILAHPTRQNTLADPYVIDEIFSALPPEPYRSCAYHVKSAPPTKLLRDADIIDLGDRSFHVLHTPGHSPGGIALWEEKTRTLIAGDVIYDGELITDAYHSNMGDYIDSMRMLSALPVETVHGGHFPSFGGGRFKEITTHFLKEHDNS
ncbi:MBL fold metallo-hydrolase [Rhodobacteraceae bacterium RKSG542]|uniref:MBL fold metallo-hydrolase n=1 Tax=Pseudovibrio flavus TaxID=2529854 RepID=UPI0012BD0615|nr:MBL fold metallo-hydrolase [Pseudovibrio flavus]MTI17721.1 MBL fold metallo-hydrolase [Pseudovibrio flavus]